MPQAKKYANAAERVAAHRRRQRGETEQEPEQAEPAPPLYYPHGTIADWTVKTANRVRETGQ